MSETNELARKLAHRQALNENEEMPRRQLKVFNPYTEFKEFTRKQIKDFEKMFKKWVSDHFDVCYLILKTVFRVIEKRIGLKESRGNSDFSLSKFLRTNRIRKSIAGQLCRFHLEGRDILL